MSKPIRRHDGSPIAAVPPDSAPCRRQSEETRMTFKVTGFNHTAFTVGDLDAVLPFFVDGLGFRQISRGPRDGELLSAMTGIRGVELEIAYVEGPGHWVELI